MKENETFNPMNEPIGKRKSMYLDYIWSQNYKERMEMKAIEWPIKLKTEGKTYEMNKPDVRLKKRHWWIVAKANAGKTKWVNKTFAGIKIYVPRMGAYPFEGYMDEDIIIYDDRDGVKFEEFSDVCNTWDIMKPIAGQIRYITQNWKIGHARNVIVMSNHTIEESMPECDHQRMKKRFVQIVNPVLQEEQDESDDEEEDNEVNL